MNTQMPFRFSFHLPCNILNPLSCLKLLILHMFTLYSCAFPYSSSLTWMIVIFLVGPPTSESFFFLLFIHVIPQHKVNLKKKKKRIFSGLFRYNWKTKLQYKVHDAMIWLIFLKRILYCNPLLLHRKLFKLFILASRPYWFEFSSTIPIHTCQLSKETELLPLSRRPQLCLFSLCPWDVLHWKYSPPQIWKLFPVSYSCR